MLSSLFRSVTAAPLVFLSGLLHLPVFVADGMTAFAGAMAVTGLIYIAIAAGLRRGWRWLSWIAFLVMTFGAVAAYILAGSDASLHRWLFLAIAVVDVLAAIVLFGSLWRAREKVASI
ncbi:MAG: hypothetical protein R3D45_16160 [Rhizobiaceae bacterium]